MLHFREIWIQFYSFSVQSLQNMLDFHHQDQETSKISFGDSYQISFPTSSETSSSPETGKCKPDFNSQRLKWIRLWYKPHSFLYYVTKQNKDFIELETCSKSLLHITQDKLFIIFIYAVLSSKGDRWPNTFCFQNTNIVVYWCSQQFCVFIFIQFTLGYLLLKGYLLFK